VRKIDLRSVSAAQESGLKFLQQTLAGKMGKTAVTLLLLETKMREDL
jgi:hypothetical protein